MKLTGLGKLGTLTPSQADVAAMVVASANKYGVPPALALGIANHESGFNPNATNKNTNNTTDWGVMQLNDVTVKTLGVADPLDPQQNIDAGVGLLGHYLTQYNGDTTKALWAYASGAGTVASGKPMNSVATQFIGYVQNYDDAPVLAAIQANGGSTSGVLDAGVDSTIDPTTGQTYDSESSTDAGIPPIVAAIVIGTVALVMFSSR